MKNTKIVLFLAFIVALSFHNPAFAQNPQAQIPQEVMNLDIPDYLGTNIIPLSAKEKKSLRLSKNWSAKGAAPFLTGNGKLMYVHGASMPTVLASPMQVCDVELQEGETVNEIVVGDSARWMVEAGQAGNTTHLFIKPVDAGLETSAVITTDRRVYHLRLISSRDDFTPYVGFTYANDLRRHATQQQAAKSKEEYLNSTSISIEGKNQNLDELNFDYSVTGKASWKPKRVYDNGQQTFIRLPASVKSNEMPILLVRKGKKNILVNYRVKEQAMIVDGIFDKIVLVIGIGASKKQVTIERGVV